MRGERVFVYTNGISSFMAYHVASGMAACEGTAQKAMASCSDEAMAFCTKCGTKNDQQARFAGENMAEKTAIQELSEIYGSPEYKKASQLAATNKAMLDDPSRAQERHVWLRAEELERTLKAAEPKRQDRDYAGNPKSPDPLVKGRAHFIHDEVMRISKLPAHEQVNAARSLRAQWRNDLKSAYNNPAHPDHKSAVEDMQRLYAAEQTAERSCP